MRSRWWLTVFAALAVAACDRYEISEHRDQWEKADLHTYRFRYLQKCTCPDNQVQPTVVQVFNDAVLSVGFVDAHPDLDPPAPADFHTVDGLFDVLEAGADKADAVIVSYDPAMGYPTSAFIDYDERSYGDELRFTVGELQSGTGS